MIYFGGKDVGIQRGHIYSLFVWPEGVPVKAQNSEKKKKKTTCRGTKAIFSGRRQTEGLRDRIVKAGSSGTVVNPQSVGRESIETNVNLDRIRHKVLQERRNVC